MREDNPRQIYVRTCTEAIEADLNIFDYSLGLLSGRSEREIQIPAVDAFRKFSPALYELSFRENPVNRIPQTILSSKPSIDFIYSNAGGHHRKKIFESFSQRYVVQSYGNFLNNQDNRTRSSWNSEWREEKIHLHKQNHFSLALENTNAAGYTTEKVLTPLEAGTVPIYFGHESAAEQINPTTFRLIRDTSTQGINEVIEWISSLSENDFETMLSEPVFSTEQLTFHSDARKERQLLFDKLAAGNLEVHRPIGYAKNLHLRRIARNLEIHRAATVMRSVWKNPARKAKT